MAPLPQLNSKTMNDTINDKPSTEDGGAVGKPAVMASASIRIRCKVCGWISTGRVPHGGDGSLRLPKKHTRGIDDVYCKGIYEEGEWL